MKFRTERLTNALDRVLLAAGVKDDDSLGYQQGGQRDVRRDGDIACGSVLRDVAVGHVRSTIDPDRRQMWIPWRELEALVCHEDRREHEAFRGADADVLHVSWGRIGVDPECQGHAGSPRVGQ
jgi:hypothetical protein